MPEPQKTMLVQTANGAVEYPLLPDGGIDITKPGKAHSKAELLGQAAQVADANAGSKHAEVDTLTKVMRWFRDMAVDIPAGVLGPGVDIAARALGSKPAYETPTINAPVGYGQTRNVLTGVGSALGAGAAGALGLPSGPGALATGAAGYAGGAMGGSMVGQALEKALPNLFMEGYAGKPEQERSLSPGNVLNTAAYDTVVNAGADAGISLAAKGGIGVAKSLMTAKGNPLKAIERGFVGAKDSANSVIADLLERRVMNKYAKHPEMIPSEDLKAALSDDPKVKFSVGQLLHEGNLAASIENLTTQFEKRALVKEGTNSNFDSLMEWSKDLAPAGASKQDIGQAAVLAAERRKKAMMSNRDKLYEKVNKDLPEIKIQKERKGPAQSTDNLDPDEAFAMWSGEPLDEAALAKKQAAETTMEEVTVKGPVHPLKTKAETDKIRNMLEHAEGELAGLKDSPHFRNLLREAPEITSQDPVSFSTLVNFRKNINDAIGGGQMDRAVPMLMDLKQAVDADIEFAMTNLWKGGDKKVAQYAAAKKYNQTYEDVFNPNVMKAYDKAIGFDKSRAFARGAEPSAFYDHLLTSTESADQFIRVSGLTPARHEFSRNLIDNFVDLTTKQIDGKKLLTYLTDPQTQGIARRFLNAKEFTSLKYVAERASKIDPVFSKIGTIAIEMTKGSAAMRTTAGALDAVTGGGFASLFGTGLTQLVGFLGMSDFSKKVLLNPDFARKLALNLGKEYKRPGMEKEVANLIGSLKSLKSDASIAKLQGTKILFRDQETGREGIFDVDKQKLEPVESAK